MPKVNFESKKPNKRIETSICSECGKNKKVLDFYVSYNPMHKAIGRLPTCKECVKKGCCDEEGNVVVDKLETMCKKLDKPFIYDLYLKALERPRDTIGNYMTLVNSLPQYKEMTYIDSKQIPEEVETSTRKLPKKTDIEVTDEIIERFGAGFSDEEYVAMQRKYDFLCNNYHLKTNMHIEALTTYVKYKVKEELATADGDVAKAKEWAKLATDAATKAKINPSQLSAADLQDGLTGFGQLARAVEQTVDVIPILPQFKERPQDKVDFCLWCYVNYIRDLKGLPPCDYKDIYTFYQNRVNEYKDRFTFLQDSVQTEEEPTDLFVTDDEGDE